MKYKTQNTLHRSSSASDQNDAELSRQSQKAQSAISKSRSIGAKRLTKKQIQTQKIQRKYWISLIKYMNQSSMRKLSWAYHKPEKFYPKMQKLFQGQRNETQIKSLDQRLKKKYYIQYGMDMRQAIIQQLSQQNLNQEQTVIFKQFTSEQSKGKYDSQFLKFFVQKVEEDLQENDKQEKHLQNIQQDLNIGAKYSFF